MFLLDRNNNQGSDGYQPGQQFRDTYQDDPLNDDDSYQSNNAGSNLDLDDSDAYQSVNPAPRSDLEDSGYESANRDNFSDPEFQDSYRQQQRGGFMDQANRAVKRGRAAAQRTLPKKIGEEFLGDKQAFKDSSPENREKVKELAKERARKAVSESIGKQIGNESFKKGFEKGLSKGAGSLAKEGAKNVAKQGAKKAAEVGTKAAAQAGSKAAAGAATTGLEAAVAGAGAATGIETLGLGFIAAFLLNIAIDLGVSEAIDCVFALKDGDIAEAKFHAVKAYMSIAMFLWLLIAIVLSFTVAGIIIGGPLMFILSAYSFAGAMFPKTAVLQGLSRKWEMALLFIMDCFLLIVIAAFVGGILFAICTDTAIGSMLGWTGVAGSVINYVDTNYGSGGAIAGLNEICSVVSTMK